MTRAELLADDPLWLILIKVVVLLLIGPVMTIFLIIWERKAIGRMQQSLGRYAAAMTAAPPAAAVLAGELAAPWR